MSGQANFKSRRPFQVNKKVRTYILPTGFGYAFGTTTLILFFLAVGYANNMIYIFVFLLMSVALTGMIITNRNTDGLEVTEIILEPIFAEEPSGVNIGIRNKRKRTLWDFEFFFQKSTELVSELTIEELSNDVIEVPFRALKRGLNSLPRLIVQSKFPFGLFRAWKVIRENPQILAYPARKGHIDFPSSAVSADVPQNAGLFRDHRVYQSSDSMMRIDWRASARRQDLLVKNFEEGDKPSLRFHWQQTAMHSDPELRLCQLSLWIDEAENRGHEYSLEVGTHKTSFSRGSSHHRHCLETLAYVDTRGLS